MCKFMQLPLRGKMSISRYGGRPCTLSGSIDCRRQETTHLSASLNPEMAYSPHMCTHKCTFTHTHTHPHIQINQWEAGGMRHKIFTSNEYSAGSSFVSSPTTVSQLNIYSSLNKWNKAHNLNTIGVLLGVSAQPHRTIQSVSMDTRHVSFV